MLNRVTRGEVRVASARFSLFNGIELFGVELADPKSADDLPFRDRVAVSCPRLTAVQDVGALLRGRLHFRKLIADGAKCLILRDEDTGDFNISRIFPLPADRREERDRRLPMLDLTNTHVTLARRVAGRLELCDEIRLDVKATPHKSFDSLVDIDWATLDDRHAEGRSVVDLRTLTFSDHAGGLPWVSLDAISLLLESRFGGIDELCDRLALRGSIRADQYEISIDPEHHQLTSAVIHLKDASMAIPLEEGTAPRDRYLRITSMDGKVICHPDGATAHLEADFGGGRAIAQVEVLGDMMMRVPIDEMGLRIEVTLAGVSLPDFDSPQRQRLYKYIQRWPRTQRIFDRYDPYGQIDVEVLLTRPPGAEQKINLDRMVVRGVDASASYQKVPYRVSHITGQVVMTPQRYEFENVGGVHDSGTVVANGGCDGALPHVACELEIEGRNISVDDDLYQALRPQQQRLWNRFQPSGAVDLDVYLSRPEVPQGQRGKWMTTVVARFLNGAANYIGFPYPLQNLAGTLTISDQTMTLDGITAKVGQGSVRIDGEAELNETGADHFDLDINAAGVAFDETLNLAMPDSLRQRVALFDPTGTFDIAGKLMLAAEKQGLDYDMTVSLNGGSATYERFPLKIQDLRGQIRLRPERIDLIDLIGRRDESPVKVSGSIDLTGTPTLELLNVQCHALMLDEECRTALPKEVVQALEGFAWSGPIDVRTTIRARPELSEEAVDIHTVIEVSGIDARYEMFDLPLQSVTGRIVLSHVIDRSGVPDQSLHVDVENIIAKHDGGTIRIDGTIDSRRDGTLSGELAMSVENLPMSASLRDALPGPIGQTWSNLEPGGRFDWTSERFRFSRNGNGSPLEWDVAGRLRLMNASMDLGIPLRSMDATMDTRINGPANELVLAGGFAIDRVEALDHLITGASGTLILAGKTKRMLIDDIKGSAYGGDIVGRVGWDGGEGGKYALNLTASDINMTEYFRAKSKGGGSSFAGPGKMAGLLRLEGEVGDLSTRRGSAQIRISDAKLYKLPILLSIFDVINWVEPDDSAFHDVTMSMLIHGLQVEFEQIALEGRSIALVGTGTMTLPSQRLDLTFLTTSPRVLGRVPLVSEILSGTLRELVEIRVSGTLNDPQVTAAPFRALEGTVRTLFEKRRVPREEKLKRRERDRSRPVTPNP